MSDSNFVEYIDHAAVVKAVCMPTGTLSLQISEETECEGCAASALCAQSGGKRDTLSLAVKNPEHFRVGDEVIIRGTERLHRKAIMVATVIPCIALIAVMVLVFLLTHSESMAALSGLGAMVCFFFLLYLMRNRMAHEFTFDVIPVSQPQLTD